MKSPSVIQLHCRSLPLLKFSLAVSCASLLLLSSSTLRADEELISSFDDDTMLFSWSWENWSKEAILTFDATNDAAGSPSSGSLRVECNVENPTGYDQSVVTGVLGPTSDAEELYATLELDVKLDATSVPRTNGTDYGLFEVILRNGSAWAWNTVGSLRFTDANKVWTHLSFPVKAPADAIHRLTFKLGENNLAGTVIYNVDNIKWTTKGAPPPPPTMTIVPTQKGLNLLSASEGIYDRQGIATALSEFGWIPRSDPPNLAADLAAARPVTFAMDISSFPVSPEHPGFVGYIFLVPGIPGTENSPDWNQPSVITASIESDPQGMGRLTTRYKVNQPGSNGTYFDVGYNKAFTAAVGVLGEWKVTLLQTAGEGNTLGDLQVTMVAPDGTQDVFMIPAADAAQFTGPVTAYFGVMPIASANLNQTALLRKIVISSGATTLLEDDFGASPLDVEKWVARAQSAAGVTVISPTDPYFIYWTTPASGYTLKISPDLGASHWNDAGLVDQLVGTNRRVLVPESVLPPPPATAGFFRLEKP